MRQTAYLAGALHNFWCFREKVLTPGRGCGILGVADIRRCGGMADTGDLKSPGSDTVPVRVRSPAPSGPSEYRGVEQLAARRAHNPEVAGSSPASATSKVLISCEIRTFSVLFCPITYLLFFLTRTLTPTGADSGKHYTAPERMLPIVFAASRLAEVVTWA